MSTMISDACQTCGDFCGLREFGWEPSGEECAYCHRPNPQHVTFDDDPICDDCSEPASTRFKRCPKHEYMFQDDCDTCFVWKENRD